MRKLTDKKLSKIIRESLKKVLTESEQVDVSSYMGHNLSVVRYDMANADDLAYFKANKQAVWDMLQSGYESIGGFKGYASRSDMIKKTQVAIFGYCDGELVTVSLYNGYLGGNKLVGATCVKGDMHDAAVEALKLIINYNIKHWDNWYWVEASGKFEKMCQDAGAFNVPSKYADLFIGKNSYTTVDNMHYKRTIGNTNVTKTIFGFNTQDTFNFLKDELIYDVNNFVDWVNGNLNEADEHDAMLNRFARRLDDLERHLKIINHFQMLKFDENLNEYPQECFDVLRKSMAYVQNCLKNKQYGPDGESRLRICLDDARKILRTSTVLEPIKLPT